MLDRLQLLKLFGKRLIQQQKLIQQPEYAKYLIFVHGDALRCAFINNKGVLINAFFKVTDNHRLVPLSKHRFDSQVHDDMMRHIVKLLDIAVLDAVGGAS